MDGPPPSYSDAIKESGDAGSDFSNLHVTNTVNGCMNGLSPASNFISPLMQPAMSNSASQPASTVPDFIRVTTPVFGPNPIEMDCPYCQAHIVTATQHIAGILPWIIVGLCFLLGFFLLIPWCLCYFVFCIDSCLDVHHFCPSCRRFLGRYSKI
ncbi:unnamed protein product [Dracunculus medinensis]|uniref:LITAF domain-containing protein n=1 Tax=Dracunculus medinensis TaxID=318479 RepID=A0A0N4UQ45_DRAME|nr:unnamed protein product [Dracunculus medinensis]